MSDAVHGLPKDARLAAEVLRDAGLFLTGQAILKECAERLEELEAELKDMALTVLAAKGQAADAWNAAISTAAQVLAEHDGAPIEPSPGWPEEARDWHITGQIDASRSWSHAILALKRGQTNE